MIFDIEYMLERGDCYGLLCDQCPFYKDGDDVDCDADEWYMKSDLYNKDGPFGPTSDELYFKHLKKLRILDKILDK